MYHHILVPLDGSTFGEHALPMALAIARRTGAEVEVVRVHVPAPVLYVGGEFAGDPIGEAELREQEQRYLDEVARRAREGAGVSVRPTRLTGSAVGEALAGHARATAADLVVMTTHGRCPLGRLLLGSIADQLVRRSDVPLLLVRPREEAPDFAVNSLPLRILVPLDGSPLAEEILEPAASLAKFMEADFLLLRIVPPAMSSNYPMPSEGINPFGESLLKQLEEQEAAARREAETYLEGVAGRLRSEGLVVRTRVVSHDQPAAAILEQARADAADLIALATHGRSGIARLFLGSVADQVLRGASIPVLVERPRTAPAAAPENVECDREPGCFHGQAVHATAGPMRR